jgi:hypothetical protein
MANALAVTALSAKPAAPAAVPAKPAAGDPPAPAPKSAAAPVVPEVTPDKAREYLKGFVIDATSLDTIEDDKVLELHGKYQERFGQKGTWPDDWREQIAGNDEKILKRLGRYATPRDVTNALLAAQNRISSGELRSALKEGATEEEHKAWRAENGIPEKPEDYDLTLPSGVVFGDEDKPFIEDFLKSAAHPANLHPSQVKSVLAWYYADREKQIEHLAEQDLNEARATSDELHQEWGNNFRGESNLIMSLLDGAPQGIKEKVMSARYGEKDQVLFNDVGFLRWLSSLQHQIDPHATVVPGGGAAALDTIESEITKIEGMMKDKRSAYWKGKMVTREGVEDTELAHRYRELISAKDAIAKRRAA